jgi:predicted MFS family arabinose efflux permease
MVCKGTLEVHESKKTIVIMGLTVAAIVAVVLSWLPMLLEDGPDVVAWLAIFPFFGWLISLALAIYILKISRKWSSPATFVKAIVIAILYICIIASTVWGSFLLLSFIASGMS